VKLRTFPEYTVRHGTISGHTMHHNRGERPCESGPVSDERGADPLADPDAGSGAQNGGKR